MSTNEKKKTDEKRAAVSAAVGEGISVELKLEVAQNPGEYCTRRCSLPYYRSLSAIYCKNEKCSAPPSIVFYVGCSPHTYTSHPSWPPLTSQLNQAAATASSSNNNSNNNDNENDNNNNTTLA